MPSASTNTPLAPTHAMSGATTVVVLSLLLGLQPITTDLYLPALPALQENLGATFSQTQLTLTALLLAFGLSQLVWGPLSDRYGRRPILLTGLVAYVLASVASALAPAMSWLIAARIVQGAAMGAGVMCARAIVRDLYRPLEGARVMSKGLTGLGITACFSPALGGLLADWLNWRAALLALSVYGALALALVLWRYQETLAQPNPQALRLGTLLSAWRDILRHPTFRTYSALAATSYAGLFFFLAGSSFVFIQLMQLSRTAYGLLMFSISLAYIAGTLVCRRLVPRIGVPRTVAWAAGLTLTGGTLMALAVWSGLQTTWALMTPFYLFMLAHGVHQPCSQSGAIGPFPRTAGTASALNGFLMMVTAFVAGGWLGARMDGTAWPMVLGIWVSSMGVALVAWTGVQRHGQPSDH